MGTNDYEGVARLNAVSSLVESVQKTYSDAKKLSIDISFEWQETDAYNDGAELCPVVRIEVER